MTVPPEDDGNKMLQQMTVGRKWGYYNLINTKSQAKQQKRPKTTTFSTKMKINYVNGKNRIWGWSDRKKRDIVEKSYKCLRKLANYVFCATDRGALCYGNRKRYFVPVFFLKRY